MPKPIDDRDKATLQVSREARHLAQRLEAAMQAELKAHQRETGWSPASIQVTMLEATTIEDRRQRFILGTVHVTPPATVGDPA